MNPAIYNGCVAAGVALVSYGVGARFGVADACIAAGALILALSAFTLHIATRS